MVELSNRGVKSNNQVFIMSIFQLENFRYSVIPVKKELIIPLKNLHISFFRVTKWHYSIIPTKQFPLFLVHHSSSPPIIEQAMLSLSDSKSTVILFLFCFFSYSATGW